MPSVTYRKPKPPLPLAEAPRFRVGDIVMVGMRAYRVGLRRRARLVDWNWATDASFYSLSDYGPPFVRCPEGTYMLYTLDGKNNVIFAHESVIDSL